MCLGDTSGTEVSHGRSKPFLFTLIYQAPMFLVPPPAHMAAALVYLHKPKTLVDKQAFRRIETVYV